MGIVIEFNAAAFRHDVSRERIVHAMQNYLYDDIWDADEDKHLVIGFDQNRNLLEIMYNVIDGQTINIFHAMKCRNIFLKLLNV